MAQVRQRLGLLKEQLAPFIKALGPVLADGGDAQAIDPRGQAFGQVLFDNYRLGAVQVRGQINDAETAAAEGVLDAVMLEQGVLRQAIFDVRHFVCEP